MNSKACLCRKGLMTLCILAWVNPAAQGKPADFMMRARIDGRMIEGQPLAWTKAQILLLGRDGRLYDFDPRSARESQKTSPRFFGYSVGEMKQALYQEFGKTSEITTTQHYVVVHPTGQKSEWATRFEELYRSFHHYFRVRGFAATDPPYPLIAIVFRSEADYFAYASREGTQLQPGMLGHYSPDSNRVFLFDTRQDGGDWRTNAETIIHEATHQMAFNTGVHVRFGESPRWLVEGLATMFEARGVYDARSFDTRRDRINEDRWHDFQDHVNGRRPEGFMAQLVASDDAFRSDASGAYAESWALTFFLAETRPRDYSKYLMRTAAREMFSEYTPAERLADFQNVFYGDLKLLEKQFLTFMKEVK